MRTARDLRFSLHLQQFLFYACSMRQLCHILFGEEAVEIAEPLHILNDQ